MSLPKWFSYFLSAVLCIAFSGIPVFAENNEALTLTSSTVVDGDTNLSVRPVIELEFSGKVDELTVLSENKDCFHLQDATGNVVALKVLFPDVQVQKRLVKHVFLTPLEELSPGALYTLTIDQKLSDKKLHTLNQAYQIRFSTGTDEVYARGAENEDLLNLGQDILVYETALAPAERTALTPQESEEPSNTSGKNSSRPVLFAILFLILLLGAVGYWNWRSSRRSSTDA